MKNALAYYNTELLTVVQSFIVQMTKVFVVRMNFSHALCFQMKTEEKKLRLSKARERERVRPTKDRGLF
jgi:hypothetical protein